MLRGFRVPEENRDGVNLMVLHGDAAQADSPYDPIAREEIEQSGLDYLALGHTHLRAEPETAGNTVYAWPGCPMGRGFDETGQKGVYLGAIEKGNVSVQFLPLSGRRYEILEVTAGDDPLNSILEALPDDCAGDIYRIVLTGESESVDLNLLHAALNERFYGLQLRDETVPPLELWTRCGDNTLEGMSLNTLRHALDRTENPRQRRLLELAARRIVEVCEGREASAL